MPSSIGKNNIVKLCAMLYNVKRAHIDLDPASDDEDNSDDESGASAVRPQRRRVINEDEYEEWCIPQGCKYLSIVNY